MKGQLENHFAQLIEYAGLMKQITDVRAGFASEDNLAFEQLHQDFNVLNCKLTPPSNLIAQLKAERLILPTKRLLGKESRGQLISGEVQKGKIEAVKLLQVVINIADGVKAVAPITEFLAEGNLTVKPGDEVETIVTWPAQGIEPASVAYADAIRVETIEELIEAAKNSSSVIGRVVGYTATNCLVEIAGLTRALPNSDFDIRPVKKTSPRRFLNREIIVQIKEKTFPEKGTLKLSISRTSALKKADSIRKQRALDNLDVGNVTEGRVTRITKKTVFIDIGGISALLKADSMSWGQTQQPRKLFKVGELLAVKVLEIDRSLGRVVVGRKQLVPDPWITAEYRYPIGLRVKGIVTSNILQGILIELESGIEGLIDMLKLSESPWPSLGAEVEVEVEAVDIARRRIMLRPTVALRTDGAQLISESGKMTVDKSQKPEQGQQPIVKQTPETLLPGTVLMDRYVIVMCISHGMPISTYQARDKRFSDRLCTIKQIILDNKIVSEPLIKELKRIADIHSVLEHPSIPPLYDYFNEADRYYLVMRWYGAGDLVDQMQLHSGRIDEATVTRWAIQICDVLHYLHTQRPPIICRDLKPGNLILDEKTGRVTLGDLSLAVSVRPTDNKVSAWGTMGYAAPELFAGKVEPRSDIYSLGAIMFHLLTGSDPQDNPLFIFDFSKNPRPRQINPSISPEMEQIIMKATTHKPEDRHSSALEMIRLLKDHARRLVGGQLSPSPVAQALKPDNKALDWTSCSHCGERIAIDDVYCSHCGSRQSGTLLKPIALGKAQLVVVGGADDGKTFKIEKESVLVGRTDPHKGIFPEVDLTMADPETQVSRQHASIFKQGERFLIEDLGSVNGTIINSVNGGSIRLITHTPRVLSNADEIRVGTTILRFEVE